MPCSKTHIFFSFIYQLEDYRGTWLSLEEEKIRYKQVFQSSQKRKYMNKSLEAKANKYKLEAGCKFRNDND